MIGPNRGDYIARRDVTFDQRTKNREINFHTDLSDSDQ